MNTSTRTGSDQKVIDRVEGELLSGRTFRLIEAGQRSVRKGGSAINARGYSGIMMALARFAGQGDFHTAVAPRAMRVVNPYVTPNECVAAVAGAIAEFVREGYFDVIGATGPEASRPSAHQHAITLRQALLLSMLMTEVEHGAGYIGHVPGIGWCVAALMERETMTVPAHVFPLTAAKR